MKKTIMIALALCMLIALAAGCSKTEQPEATPTPAPTDIPSVTAPPADENASGGLNAANDSQAPTGVPGQGPKLDSEDAKTAYSMMGSEVSELYKVIGEPEKAEYTASCIAPGSGAEDGLLYYDGFTVSTVRYPNGSEQIYGVF